MIQSLLSNAVIFTGGTQEQLRERESGERVRMCSQSLNTWQDLLLSFFDSMTLLNIISSSENSLASVLWKCKDSSVTQIQNCLVLEVVNYSKPSNNVRPSLLSNLRFVWGFVAISWNRKRTLRCQNPSDNIIGLIIIIISTFCAS